MAFETYEQIQEAFKDKDGNQENIQKAIELQQRLRFHSDYSQFKLNGNYWGKGSGMARKEAPRTMSEAQNDFLELVGLLLNPSQNETSGKFQVFSYLYTNRNSSIVEMMKDEDQRIFTAKDATEEIIVDADNEKAKEKNIRRNCSLSVAISKR